MREYGGGIWLLMARSEWEIDGTKCERKRKEGNWGDDDGDESGGYKSGVDPVISGVDGAWIFRRWSVDFPSMERGFSVDGAMVASVCIGI